jgi:hypothetical protein
LSLHSSFGRWLLFVALNRCSYHPLPLTEVLTVTPGANENAIDLVLAKWKEQSHVVCHLRGDFTRPKTKFQMHVTFLFARQQYLSTFCFSLKVGEGQTIHITCWHSFLVADWDLSWWFIRYMEWQTLWHWIKTWCKALS